MINYSFDSSFRHLNDVHLGNKNLYVPFFGDSLVTMSKF